MLAAASLVVVGFLPAEALLFDDETDLLDFWASAFALSPSLLDLVTLRSPGIVAVTEAGRDSVDASRGTVRLGVRIEEYDSFLAVTMK